MRGTLKGHRWAVSARFVIVENQEQVDKVIEAQENLHQIDEIIYLDKRGMRKYDHIFHNKIDSQESSP